MSPSIEFISLGRRDDANSTTAAANILVDDDEFVPKESAAIVGDVVFHIRHDKMSVASSSLDTPCQPNRAGRQFWSGKLNVSAPRIGPVGIRTLGLRG